MGIDHLIEFNDYLYAGTWNYDYGQDQTYGGEVWRSADGEHWTPIANKGFGVPSNGEVFRFAIFNDALYASTWSYADDRGAEIWRSSTGIRGDWTRVVTNGFGDAHNQAALSFETFNGYLYAGTYNWTTGGEVWRSPTGDPGTWIQVNADGFGEANNYAVIALAAFNGYLYASTGNWDPNIRASAGGQLWRCAAASGCDENSDWSQVVSDGFGNPDNVDILSLVVFDNALYAVTSNFTIGLEVWRSGTGDPGDWEQVGFAGFGDSNNGWTYWHNAVSVFNNALYIGTWNNANGGEVWRQKLHEVFLPLVQRGD